MADGVIIVQVVGKCSFEDCESDATQIASGRADDENPERGHPTPAVYCDTHGDMVADEQFPEYHDTCPNCGCRFGVN